MSASLMVRIWGAGGLRLLLGDAVVLLVLCAAVIALALPGAAGGRPARAEVEAAGKLPATLDLERDGVTEAVGPLGVTRIEVRDGRVRVVSSPCPRQACRHGGWIGAAGEMLVCLPNEIVIRLPGQRAGAIDAVAR
ncbi:MAG: NusG domain II-containing protein [Candidatus Methylomirabilia bacterium]